MKEIKKGSLIASCQAVEGEVLHPYNIMQYMAKACVSGGADAIRANSVRDINEIKKMVDVPVIGIIKKVYGDSSVYITPTLNEVKELLSNTDVDVIALDATMRKRHNDEKLEDLVDFIRKNSNVKIMADISNFEEAKNAEKLGFDYIGTTLRSYTEYTANEKIPDYNFLKELVSKLKTKIIAEGGIWEVNQYREVLKTGIWATVIGTAITRPSNITERFSEVRKEC